MEHHKSEAQFYEKAK